MPHKRKKGPSLSQQLNAFGPIGGSAGDRIKRAGKIAEDDPRWNPQTMGNRRRRVRGFTRGPGQ